MPNILRLAVPVPLRRQFDYLPPPEVSASELQPGVRLLVPFGRRRLVGYLLATDDRSDVPPNRLKPAISVLDAKPLLSAIDCEWLRWAADYYHHPIGEVFASAFPVALRQGESTVGPTRWSLTTTGREAALDDLRRAPQQARLLQWLRQQPSPPTDADFAGFDGNWRPALKALIARGWVAREFSADGPQPIEIPPGEPPLPLNPAQSDAVDAAVACLGRFAPMLLEGVTGSGKTEIYLRLVERVLADGKQAMVLLPEISLTPQLQERFRRRFPVPIAVFHSGLGDRERRDAWLAFQSGRAAVLLGTRSAVFTPMPRPGLLILDEEHDGSYKQQDGFRFSARDLAVMRARYLNVPVMLGSATPSLESLANVARGQYRRLQLPQRAGAARPPVFRRIDLRGKSLREGLSPALIEQIHATLAKREQILLFLNRRGYAPSLICHTCGKVCECHRCDSHLVVHADDQRLRCHHCGHEQKIPPVCPHCGHPDLRPLGLGTERVEKALRQVFPNARVQRIDRDNTRRKGSLDALLEAARSGDSDILLGTQMLAKGHHFPNVTLVGILDVDAGLFAADFRAAERTAQLIVQVAGRAGRESLPGTVLLQTYHPEHPLLLRLLHDGYGAFADDALAERRAAGLPPYGYQALWRAEANRPEPAEQFLTALAAQAKVLESREVQVLGPVPAPLARRAGRFRFQLLLQAETRKSLHRLLDRLLAGIDERPDTYRARWSLDVDPIDWA